MLSEDKIVWLDEHKFVVTNFLLFIIDLNPDFS